MTKKYFKLLAGLSLVVSLTLWVSSFRSQSFPAQIADQLQSSNPIERATAFVGWQRTAKGNESNESVPILLNLLERENQLFETTLAESEGRLGVGDKFGEDYAEYYKELLETFDRIADKKTPGVVEVIAGGTYNAGWPTAIQLAKDYPDRVLPVALEKTRHQLVYRRYEGLDMLTLIFQHAQNLRPDKLSEVRNAIIRMTSDSESVLRRAGVRVLGRIGDSRDLELLRGIAKTDNGVMNRQGIEVYPVREEAANAVKLIEERSKK